MRSLLHTLKKRLYLAVATYFRFWANLSLKRWRPRIIAVTGSVGKTTMLHLLEVQLGERAHYSHFANSAYGIAFDVVGLRGVTGSKLQWIKLFVLVPFRSLYYKRTQEFYVVEIDGERPKETGFLADWLKPEVTLWVSLGRSHAVFFDAQVKRGEFKNAEEAIAFEFARLPKATVKLVVADAGNKLMNDSLKDIQSSVELVSEVSLKKYEVWPNKTNFTFQNGVFSFNYPLPRETYVQLAMLEKLAEYLGVQIRYDMRDFVMPPGRSSYFEGKKNTKLVDSTYNAHLISMKSVLAMAEAMPVEHKWLVIGDMVEQGAEEGREHEGLGEAMAQVKAEKYLLVGRRTQKYTLPVLRTHGLEQKSWSFDKATDALKYLEENLQGGETIVFKGSQYLEGIVEALLLKPEDSEKLCRRETASLSRRAKWGQK